MNHQPLDLKSLIDSVTLPLVDGHKQRVARAIMGAYAAGCNDTARAAAQHASAADAMYEANQPGGIDPATYGR